MSVRLLRACWASARQFSRLANRNIGAASAPNEMHPSIHPLNACAPIGDRRTCLPSHLVILDTWSHPDS